MRIRKHFFSCFLCVVASFLSILAAQDDSWKELANRRIQQFRQRDLQVRVVDERGSPLPGVQVELVQKRRAFPLGAAINRAILTNERYREFFLAHFNWAVLDNASKWYANERTPGKPDFSAADAVLQWCKENGIPVRGHCVFWEPEKWQLDWVKGLSPDQLREAVERRLMDAMGHFRGRFVHWDVNNEMLHGSFFKDRLGEEIHPWMYQKAHQIDPGARLFVNEFNILSVDQDFQEVQVDEYVEHIRKLQQQGAPIHGVGIQGHVWYEDILSTPQVLKDRLDKVSSLGLPIWISEFDTADPDEQKNADILELVLRTAYSHPAVEGIVLWAFWAGNSWRGPNSGLVRTDWTLNAAGRRFESLMAEWSTRSSGLTKDDGTFNCRGFFGLYSLVLRTPEGMTQESELSLSPGTGARTETIEIRIGAGQ